MNLNPQTQPPPAICVPLKSTLFYMRFWVSAENSTLLVNTCSPKKVLRKTTPIYSTKPYFHFFHISLSSWDISTFLKKYMRTGFWNNYLQMQKLDHFRAIFLRVVWTSKRSKWSLKSQKTRFFKAFLRGWKRLEKNVFFCDFKDHFDLFDV